MLIKINGEEIEVADASTIQDVIDETNAPYTPGSIICLIKGKKELENCCCWCAWHCDCYCYALEYNSSRIEWFVG